MDASPRLENKLKWHHQALLVLLAAFMRLWGRTLRFSLDPSVYALMNKSPGPSVVILWHNRLFAAPAFYRRFFKKRRLAALISASRDGSWLAGFVSRLGMRPIRGSRYSRGPQALRELIAAQKSGCDVAVTPDGSRGPLYDMKAGAVTVALKTGAPIVLLSLNHRSAWRLKSWDHFFIPYPFSRIDVRVELIEPTELRQQTTQETASFLKVRLDAMTVD